MATSREYYLAHQDELKAKARLRSKRWRDEDPERARRSKDAFLAKRVGLTLEQYYEALEARNGKCQICNNDSKLVLDHDHTSGKFRGFLCHSCNLAIGKFKDSVEYLESAIKYLRKSHDN